MNVNETTVWAADLLPGELKISTRRVLQGFPEFTVADIFLGTSPGSSEPEDRNDESDESDASGAVGVAETVAFTLDAATIDPGLVTDDGADLRVEFVTVTSGHSAIAADLVVAAATMIAQDPHLRSPQPGLLMPDLGWHVDKTITAKHGLLIPPFLWEDGVPRVHEVDRDGRPSTGGAHDWTHPGRMTVVAQLVMLTDEEFTIATDQGPDAVQQVVLNAGTDLNDVWR